MYPDHLMIVTKNTSSSFHVGISEISFNTKTFLKISLTFKNLKS